MATVYLQPSHKNHVITAVTAPQRETFLQAQEEYQKCCTLHTPAVIEKFLPQVSAEERKLLEPWVGYRPVCVEYLWAGNTFTVAGGSPRLFPNSLCVSSYNITGRIVVKAPFDSPNLPQEIHQKFMVMDKAYSDFKKATQAITVFLEPFVTLAQLLKVMPSALEMMPDDVRKRHAEKRNSPTAAGPKDMPESVLELVAISRMTDKT